jgi:DNA polymerase-3 subunit gamma/tau
MVSTQGFNALLKLVEEPPPHVKFIFATTEPDKVIGTIRSRTHHYPFRLVPPRVLTDYLAKLCAAEGITVEPAVLPLVVRAGAGSVRDSLSVLDQLLGGADESGVAYRQAAALLGYTPDSLLDEFVDAFAAGDAGGVFSCVDKVIEVGQDPRRFAEDLLRRLRDLVIVAAVPDALSSGLVDVAADQAERLSSQAASLGAGELTRAAEVIAAGLTDMRGTTAPRLHLELMCARVLLPGADIDNRGVHARLDRLERRLGVVGSTTELRRPSSINTAPIEPAPAEPAPPEIAATGTAATGTAATGTGTGSGEVESVPDSRPTEDRAPASSPSPPPPTREGVGPPIHGAGPEAPVPPLGDARGSAGGESDDTALGPHRAGPGKDSGQPGLTVTDVRRLWPEVLEEVKGKRRFTWILLSQNAHVAEVRNGTLLLAMANAGARDSFGRGGSEDVLREAIVVVLGADFTIQTMVDPSAAGVPSAGVSSAGVSSAGASPAGVSSVGTGGQGRMRPAEPGPPPAPSVPPAAGPVSPPPPAAASVPEPAAPADLTARRKARENIRPTRKAAARDQDADDRDAVARRDDSDVDEMSESHTELLARALGAEVIAEEEDGA